MKQPELLIRTQQRWLPRVLDFVVTLLGWAGFAVLFANGFLAVLRSQPSAQSHVHFGLLAATIVTLAMYFLVGLINALVLYSWALYNQFRRRTERRAHIPPLTNEQLRTSFALPVEMHQTLRSSQICSVENDEEGNIVGVSVGSNHIAGSVHVEQLRPTAATRRPGDGATSQV